MVVARKSTVSTKSTRFWRDSILSLGRRRRSARLESAVQSDSIPTTQAAPVSSARRKRSSKKLPISSTNEAVMPKLPKELGRQQLPNLGDQPNQASKSSEVGFLGLPIMPGSGATPLWLLRLYTFHRYSS